MKAGSFDNYLLQTKPQDIGSKMGLHLRDLIKRKKADPTLKIGYVPGTAKLPRTRKTTAFEHRRIPAMYMPAHIKATEDQSKYYMKTPQEMSRYEIAELEREFKELDEPEEFVDEQEMLESEEFRDL